VLSIWAYSLSASAASTSKTRSDTSLAPAHVTSVNQLKVAKAFGQVTPGDTDTITGKYCLDKEAIIFGSHYEGSHSAREQVLNTLPLLITESVASDGHGTSLQEGKEKGFFLQKERCTSNDQVVI